MYRPITALTGWIAIVVAQPVKNTAKHGAWSVPAGAIASGGQRFVQEL
jgi:hypothetical protein